MNNRGIFRFFAILLLILVILILYFYTEPTKEIVGMLVENWDPLDIDEENKTITLQLADASEMAHKVVLEAEGLTEVEAEEEEPDEPEEEDRPIPYTEIE